MNEALKTNMAIFMPTLASVQASLIFILNPESPMAEGVTVAPDTSPGAAPYSVTFSGSFDAGGNGIEETSLAGKATFNSDPAYSWSGLSGTVTSDTVPSSGQVYHSEVGFMIDSEQTQVQGSVTYTDSLAGSVTTLTVPAGSPLAIVAADGSAGATANACGFSIDGQIHIVVTGSTGTLTTDWTFDSGSASVAVSNTSFTDNNGTTTILPNSNFTLACTSNGSINDWAGSYDQFWACLPFEWGFARITIAVAGPDTISVNDEDPPGSGDINSYQATQLGNFTHAVRGYFIGGETGDHYREDFNWTLRTNSSGFAQVSRYEYTEGPNTGIGGICAARATRAP